MIESITKKFNLPFKATFPDFDNNNTMSPTSLKGPFLVCVKHQTGYKILSVCMFNPKFNMTPEKLSPVSEQTQKLCTCFIL